jgi:DNA processing protein
LNNKTINYSGFELYYKGNTGLLNKPKIAIVGSRRAGKYAKETTRILAKRLSKKYVIVSGGALGIDKTAHEGAYPNTIFVSPSSLDNIYPKSNTNLIKSIYENGLALSEYEKHFAPFKHTFLQRNKIIVKISDFVIIAEAELKSGSMRSFEWAGEFGKKVYVLPHRLGESSGTRHLAQNGLAEVIWDIDVFCKNLGIEETSAVLGLNEALEKYGNILYEMELEGKVEIKNGKAYFK